ncbi:MAG: hypothetical protein WA982_10055 [Rubrobacteraceae bacterium]
MSFGREEHSHRRRRGLPTQRKTPLRLLLLLVLLVILLALLGIGALLATRSFGNEVSGKVASENSINSDRDPSLSISNERGKIRIEGVKAAESVELEVTKYALGADLQEARERASEVTANISKRDSNIVIETNGGRETGADCTVQAPQGSSVAIESGAGDVEVANLEGDVSIRAGAGDVEVNGTKGSVEISSLQGDVEVSDVSTDTEQVDVDVGVGNAVMRDLVIGTLDVQVETGDIFLSGRFSGSGQALVQTGDIIVRLSPEEARDLTFQTRVGSVVREPNKPGEE